MTNLITGGSGKLGRELVEVYSDFLHPSHDELDVTDKLAVLNYVRKIKADIIIHCAAVTDVRLCEVRKDLAWRVNIEGTENLVKACLEYNNDCYFVYISTACVFYGDKGNYVETDLPYPKNFYSLTKLLGEFIVKSSNLRKWLILRTNFVPKERWRYPKAFIDRFGTYLFANDVALAVKSLVDDGHDGIVHVHGHKKMSMYELAKITTPDVEPMTLSEYEGPPLTVDMSLRSIRIKPFSMSNTQ